MSNVNEIYKSTYHSYYYDTNSLNVTKVSNETYKNNYHKTIKLEGNQL